MYALTLHIKCVYLTQDMFRLGLILDVRSDWNRLKVGYYQGFEIFFLSSLIKYP